MMANKRLRRHVTMRLRVRELDQETRKEFERRNEECEDLELAALNARDEAERELKKRERQVSILGLVRGLAMASQLDLVQEWHRKLIWQIEDPELYFDRWVAVKLVSKEQ